ncbi:MAG: ATP-dependent protease, partial [Candidatus Aenigmatarchaeota archaeon]
MRKLIFLLTLFLLITPCLALKETTIYLPAVEDTGYGHKGALASVTVDIKEEGNGHVYVDTWPLTKVDTQASAIIAKKVACDTLFLDCSTYDFYYTIRSEAQIVGGPSGGAAMTVATLASLLDTKINNNIMITGTINLDGSIGAVAGIIEKAEAVSEMGNTFLIPKRHFIFEENTSGQVDVTKYASEHWNLTVKKVS